MRKYTKKFNAQVFFLKFNSIKINKLSNNNHYLDFYEQKARKMKTYLMKRKGLRVAKYLLLPQKGNTSF